MKEWHDTLLGPGHLGGLKIDAKGRPLDAVSAPPVIRGDYTVRTAANGGWTVWSVRPFREETSELLGAFTNWGDLVIWLAGQHAKLAERLGP